MKIKPLGAQVLVEPLELGDKTDSGLYLPESAKEKPQKGKVISVGTGHVEDKKYEMDVQAGDTILFGKYSPTEIKIDGKEFYFVEMKDILAIIEGDK